MNPRSLRRCGHPGPSITENQRQQTKLLHTLQSACGVDAALLTRLSQMFFSLQVRPASMSVMYTKHCPVCNQAFPSGAWTCPHCGAGPVIQSEEQWQIALSRIALFAKWAMYGSGVLIALIGGIDQSTLGWFLLLVPAYWSHQYFQDRVAGNTAQLSALLFVRQEDSLNTRGIYDLLMGLVSVCVITTAVAFAVTIFFG